MYFFNKYLSTFYYMPIIVPGAEGTNVDKIDRVPALLESPFLGIGTRQYTREQTSTNVLWKKRDRVASGESDVFK